MTATEWDEVWDALNREFPPYRMSDDELAKQGAEWFGQLKTYSAEAVREAWREYWRTSAKRPHFAQLRDGVLAQTRRLRGLVDLNRPRPVLVQDSNCCPCGCGGQRWARLLADGQRTRDELECRRLGVGSPPPGAPARHDERGIPVYGLAPAVQGAA